MRTKFLLGTLVVGLFCSPPLFGKKESLAPKLSVRQEFQSELSNLKKNLKAARKPEDKWKTFSKSEKEMGVLRKNNPIQIDQDEIYMDLITDSLKQIPRGAAFKKAECRNYKSTIQAAYDPKGEEKPNPPIAETLMILEILCL